MDTPRERRARLFLLGRLLASLVASLVASPDEGRRPRPVDSIAEPVSRMRAVVVRRLG